MYKDEHHVQTKAEAALRRHDVLPLSSLGSSAMFSAMNKAMNERGDWLGQYVSCDIVHTYENDRDDREDKNRLQVVQVSSLVSAVTGVRITVPCLAASFDPSLANCASHALACLDFNSRSWFN